MKHAITLVIGAIMFVLSFLIAFNSGRNERKEVEKDPFEVQVPLSDGSGSGTAKDIIKRYSINSKQIQEIDDYLNEVENYETEIRKEVGDI